MELSDIIKPVFVISINEEFSADIRTKAMSILKICPEKILDDVK